MNVALFVIEEAGGTQGETGAFAIVTWKVGRVKCSSLLHKNKYNSRKTEGKALIERCGCAADACCLKADHAS